MFDAAVTRALLYSSEFWSTSKVKNIEKKYDKLMNCLLGVCRNTNVNSCMLEAGISPINRVLSERRKRFMLSQINQDDRKKLINYAHGICMEGFTSGYQFLESSRTAYDDINSLESMR